MVGLNQPVLVTTPGMARTSRGFSCTIVPIVTRIFRRAVFVTAGRFTVPGVLGAGFSGLGGRRLHRTFGLAGLINLGQIFLRVLF